VVGNDNLMSRLHFEIRDEPGGWWVRDLNSANGTFLNGEPVAASVLKDGDEIVAGKTRFSVDIKIEPPALGAGTENGWEDEAANPLHEQLLKYMRGPLQPLYAVLDAAKEQTIFKMLVESKAPYYWLFAETQTERLAHFVPYLVPLPAESTLLETVVRSGWGKNWGVYLRSGAALEELVDSLRRLLVARLPDGRDALLRFYDPRILRALLMNSSQKQRRQLFAAVTFFLMEGEDPGVALGFSTNGQQLQRTELAIAAGKIANATLVEPFEFSSPGVSDGYFRLDEKQVKLLDGLKTEAFQQQMLEELRESFSEQFAVAGEEEMKRLVEFGCARPKRYGIGTPAGVRRYIKLMMKLGRDFDVDENLAWAAHLLGMRLTPAEKLNRLEQKADTLKAAEGKVAPV
jgi:hypothetical protein